MAASAFGPSATMLMALPWSLDVIFTAKVFFFLVK
jgi:hypothetical protein